MDTLFSVFLGLLFLFSTVGNVSGQIPTGKDEQGERDSLQPFLFGERKSSHNVFLRFLHLWSLVNPGQVCLDVGEKFASALKTLFKSLWVVFVYSPDASPAHFVKVFNTVKNVKRSHRLLSSSFFEFRVFAKQVGSAAND